MPQMNMIEAIRDALDVKMSQDPNVLVFGEDVGYFGGVFRATAGLQETHGIHRCFDTPISEGGIVGIAIGMAANGLRPVAEIQFADYIYPAYDQIASEAARLRYRSNGDFTAPITIRTPVGGGIYGGTTHSQSPEALFTHIAGLKTVIPSNPYDAKGMLIAAIEDNDPILFLEPKRLYNGPFYGDPHAPAKARCAGGLMQNNAAPRLFNGGFNRIRVERQQGAQVENISVQLHILGHFLREPNHRAICQNGDIAAF